MDSSNIKKIIISNTCNSISGLFVGFFFLSCNCDFILLPLLFYLYSFYVLNNKFYKLPLSYYLFMLFLCLNELRLFGNSRLFYLELR
jgi:hypothetical protein